MAVAMGEERMGYAAKLDNKQKINLRDYDPGDTGKITKEAAEARLLTLGEELGDLQEWLYAAQKHAILIVLQGLDTSGKDGTIEHVMSSVNPQGCAVAAFKVPTAEEAAHDFLWRVHEHAPARGMITIFNRSHYEDVLVTRVHQLIDQDTCERRYRHINNFEDLLVDSNTLILKFFLHISKKEQEERLLDREKEAEKSWKLSVADWQERMLWDKYTDTYENALGATSTKRAPWYIVPADHKWFRNLAVASTIVETLRAHKDEWVKTLEELGEQRRAELEAYRAENGKR